MRVDRGIKKSKNKGVEKLVDNRIRDLKYKINKCTIGSEVQNVNRLSG